jgi:glucose-6-phosphate 1-dehydrogenase
MVQNHMMEPMVSFDPDEILDKKVDVLHAVLPISAVQQCAVRGQYGRGTLHGKRERVCRREEGFAALKLFVDNWRWQRMPFYPRTGKRLPRQFSGVAVRFRSVTHQSFPPESGRDWHGSRLVLPIKPEEGTVMGPKMPSRPVEMRVACQDGFEVPLPDAYETLLWDMMNHDATLFMRADQVAAAWQLLMPVLEAWAESNTHFPNHTAGSWGPKAAEELLAREGHFPRSIA